MLRSLVDLVIALLDLVRAYAQELQSNAQRAGTRFGVLAGVGLIAVGVVIGTLLLAMALLLAALFLLLEASMAPATAALLTGLIVWFVIGGGTWIAIRRALR